ncbi:hypothetical protein [Herpetosiphon llansteffanensis]|uniref:hypothetical protein n=1 Tax=Herpetosiphon llansteffanensis TaxID=2094568 RepID=UPI000D7C2CEA|nr:hypothetical protein [Herpetosiphon llansteffanensis]
MSLIAGNLAVVQKLLDGAQMAWGIYGGAAAHFYGSRRPINDIDIVVPANKLSEIARLLQQGQKAVQYDGGRILWRGIILQEDLTIRQNGAVYPFVLDDPMIERLQRKPLLGSRVLFLAPEDILVHKLILYRGSDQQRFDIVDCEGIIKRQQLDLEYLNQRLQNSNATALVTPRIAEMGVTL